ncbi:522_t:CDS:2 [Paraglomus brasilianum]|uniref:522_t:CDS:1 n=1 Tax=Paraglomus brasilianum TaxID=144538 RepID=A0A9N9APH5_9GLOM|nr:522_t:CDS:2 [Paraglomus brasilianum]
MSEEGKEQQPKADERIILNVGGVKFETYRSTLTAYPDTFLGTMFGDRNQSMLHPYNGNEYFFDRDGRVFHYIMQYYRTGKIMWKPHADCCSSTVTREEILQEVDFFQISREEIGLNEQHPVALMLDKFVEMLKACVWQAMAVGETIIEIVFAYNNKEVFEVSPDLNMLNDIVRPFAECGYFFLSMFGREIEQHLKTEFAGLSCGLIDKTEDFYKPGRIVLKISWNNRINRKQILGESCLAKHR